MQVTELDTHAEKGTTVNMESIFNSVSLDIIGKAVFNYEFGSVTAESPVIHPTPHTLHCNPYTLHRQPYTIHYSLYTIH